MFIQIFLVGSERRTCFETEGGDPELIIIRVINFEVVQPICSRYINVTEGQTDGLTDDLR